MTAPPPQKPPKLIYFATEDWVFCLHRLPLARAARAAGHEVVVVTRVRKHAAAIEAAGLRLIPLEMARGGMRPWQELRTLLQLIKIYRAERPDLAHHVAVKPVLYGAFAAALTGVPAVVNALTGLGFLFTSRRLLARLLRPPVEIAMRLLLNRRGSRVIFQNADDMRALIARGIVDAGNARLIRGSGVDVEAFMPSAEPAGAVVVVLPARLLWDKGVGEFVAAARLLRGRGLAARFALVGDRDAENPAAVPQATLDAWRAEGVVELWGWRNDMAAVYRDCHIVCLPSYREGFPKVLLEAAACARALVSTDVEGCREAVSHDQSGLLVPVRDAPALADALAALIENPVRRAACGAAARAIVTGELSLPVVIERTFAVYREILSP
jgi:glycosyltransferase involved in cell wall biosynthesis